ncbi:MAG: hypothetical protein ABJB86_24475, partial [Bacteroidota bacterium]
HGKAFLQYFAAYKIANQIYNKRTQAKFISTRNKILCKKVTRSFILIQVIGACAKDEPVAPVAA